MKSPGWLIAVAWIAFLSPVPAADVTITIENPTQDEIREFKLSLVQVFPGGEAIANGEFHRDLWKPVGEIYITGLPENLVARAEWHGWLQRTGTKIYRRKGHEQCTAPSYRVVPAPRV